MSAFGKHGYRCDYCGRFSNNRDGEYTKPDRTCGYISQPEWERERYDVDGKHSPINSENDICEECAAGRCIGCGSDHLVRITPATPGPDGWGWRCKACGKRWYLPVNC